MVFFSIFSVSGQTCGQTTYIGNFIRLVTAKICSVFKGGVQCLQGRSGLCHWRVAPFCQRGLPAGDLLPNHAHYPPRSCTPRHQDLYQNILSHLRLNVKGLRQIKFWIKFWIEGGDGSGFRYYLRQEKIIRGRFILFCPLQALRRAYRRLIIWVVEKDTWPVLHYML